jgi:hypothetical protein
MATPLVSALVLNYRGPQDTVRCVQNLQRQTIADRMEMIVIDNASCDDSIGVLRNRLGKMQNVRIVESPKNLGFGGGNNVGARYATGEYILIINPDTEPEADSLERLIAILQEDPGIGIVAPMLAFSDGTVRDSHRNFPTLSALVAKRTPLGKLMPGVLDRYLHRRSAGTMLDVDWVVGAFMLLKRDLYKELGGFDERYFLFLEDTDLCRRCWQTGRRVVYCTGIRAADGKRRLSGEGVLPILTTKVGRIHIASALKYFWKWRGTPLPQGVRR